MAILDEFRDVLNDIESLFQMGRGKHDTHWSHDRTPSYHVAKAISHISKHMIERIDPDTGKSHLVNAVARLLIALGQIK
jgi:hypothetical protein